MRASLRIASVLVSLALSSAACGDDGGGEGGSGSGDATTATGGPSTGTDATTSSSGAGGDDTSSSSGAGGEACVPPATEGPECDFPDPQDTDEQIRAFDAFYGTVSTLDGNPIANHAIQVCGINICLYGDTDEDGNVVVPQGGTALDAPLFKVGDGLELAKFGYHLPDEGAEPQVDGLTLPLIDSETPLEGNVTAEADGVVLTVPDGGGVGLNILEFGSCGQDTFRAAVVPADSIDAIAPGEGFVALVGLGPHETLFCPSAGISIPNDTDLEPGTEVEFVQQSLQTGQYFGAWGQWESVAVGRVSDDGSAFVTDDGEGIPTASPTGVRPL